jgi:hypothetical protein
MCIFSGRVSAVANTRIFARSADGSRQFLVYRMQYQADADLAMILPLPTPVSAPEDAVRFIDLSGYPQFFNDMAAGFIEPQTRLLSPAPLPAAKPNLIVHQVGSFEASFVPHLRDFSRLDARFRLPEQTWDQIPRYADYGFAVFKLQSGARNIHPMVFEFPRRNPSELFFPTIHIHDGTVETKAHFDHALYCQTPQPQPDWRVSSDEPWNGAPLRAEKFIDCEKAQGLVDAQAVIQMKRMQGMYPNTDIVIQENH